MKSRWKRILALYLSVMLGCLLPMSTMRAAEEAAENADVSGISETASEEMNDLEPSEIVAEDTDDSEISESASEETDNSEMSEAVSEDINVSGPSEDAAENPAHDLDSAVLAQIIKTEKEIIESTIYAQAEETDVPVIEIQLEGVNRAQELDGKIEYNVYIGNHGQRLYICVNQDSDMVSLSYYLDMITDESDQSRSEEELVTLWQTAEQSTYQEVGLEKDGKYVLYVKAATAYDQVFYARTDGIVIDTTAPVITGINNGGVYPAGTKFGVEDDNLDTVFVNEQPVVPSSVDGTYQVAAIANSASCVIRAKDKVGNETVYSITVEDKETENDTNVINGDGVYSLQAGAAYRLDYGNWTLEGDNTVYRGGSTFYVKEDGTYRFKRSQ